MHLGVYAVTTSGPDCGACTLLWEESSIDFNGACCQPASLSFAVFYTDLDSEENVVTEFSRSQPKTYHYEPEAVHFTPNPFYVGSRLCYFATHSRLCRIDLAKQQTEVMVEFDGKVVTQGFRDQILAVETEEDEILLLDLSEN